LNSALRLEGGERAKKVAGKSDLDNETKIWGELTKVMESTNNQKVRVRRSTATVS